MKKKVDIEQEEVQEEVAPTPRLAINFNREDLNEMRDAINELYER